MLESPEAALWCFWHTHCYADCILAAAILAMMPTLRPLSPDSWRGAYYGYRGIRKDWLQHLYWHDEICALAERLYHLQPASEGDPPGGLMPPLPEERTLLAQLTLPLNRCNVPAPVLASLAFQQYPVSLQLDGIETFYPELFDRLVCCRDARQRVSIFNDYMAVRFRLPEAKLNLRPDADPVPGPAK